MQDEARSKRNDAIKAALREVTRRATVSREAARALLIEEGIYHPDGTLTEEFGGARRARKGSGAHGAHVETGLAPPVVR